MNDSIFRMYDIRGKVGSELVIEHVCDLARAVLYYMNTKKKDIRTVVVGMDGRLHSPAIHKEVCRAIQDSGYNVLSVGTCPTPVVYFAMHTEPVEAGIMITASHNPGEYNGLKLCLGKDSLWGTDIEEIQKLFHEKKHLVAEQQGAYEEKDVIEAYIDWICDHFSHLRGVPCSLLVDCGNGAAGTVLPRLINKMGWGGVQLLYEEVDGRYPHHEADPTVMKNMLDLREQLAEKTFDFGVGLDGDCDRMGAMTSSGFLIPGDQMLSVFAQGIKEDHSSFSVVFDIKGSDALIQILKTWGIQSYMSPTGYSFVKQEMAKRGALLAGELSCHFIFKDRYFGFDDGIYAMIRLMELVYYYKKPLEQLLTVYPKKISSPDFRIPCDDAHKFAIVKEVEKQFALRTDVTMLTIDGVRAHMKSGWGSLRASNTQPVLSLRVEADTEENFDRIKEEFIEVLAPYVDRKLLKEKMVTEK